MTAIPRPEGLHATLPEPSADAGVAQLAAARLYGLDGRPTRLRGLFAERTTVVALVRQFGCLFCHELVAELEARLPEFTRLGAHVAVVGPGSVEQANRFATHKHLVGRVEVFADPSLVAFKALELPRSYVRTFLHPGAVSAYGRARAAGHAITGVHGDVPQLSGLVVVRPPAELVYAHTARFAGDHPDLDAVLEATRHAATGARFAPNTRSTTRGTV